MIFYGFKTTFFSKRTFRDFKDFRDLLFYCYFLLLRLNFINVMSQWLPEELHVNSLSIFWLKVNDCSDRNYLGWRNLIAF